MKGIKKLLAAGLAGLLLTVPVGAEETTWEEIPHANIPAAVIQKEVAEAEGMQVALSLPVKSAILIDQNTGTVRYEMNADEKLPPASITKIMTMLLVCEAVDAGQISLESAAAEVPLSPGRLSRLFVEETGRGFSDFLTEIRIERAKELLVEPGASVKLVSAACGYPDPNYFARLFKKATGYTPSAFASDPREDLDAEP